VGGATFLDEKTEVLPFLAPDGNTGQTEHLKTE
jgi:hypothetical protein